MKRKSLDHMPCPVAQSLGRVGEQWSILILRDALNGLTRFDEFEKSLDIAPNMLTRRLGSLVEAGFLEKNQYSERPPRYEYLLTDRGRDFEAVIQALLAFGNRHFATKKMASVIIDTETGAETDPIMVDRNTGLELTRPRFRPSSELRREQALTNSKQ